MNKYQEAISKIANIDLQNYTEEETGLTELPLGLCYTPYIELLDELVEKEIPMKPLKGEMFTPYLCPTCDDGCIYLDHYYELNRCANCGQKIDWSDKRE